jgi:hypothetical protein
MDAAQGDRATWTLRIEFGGLCMFVQRKLTADKTGLFVLMPDVPGMEHEPIAELGHGNSKLRVPLKKFHVDLTHLASHGQTKSNFTGCGNASRYASKAVDEVFLSGKKFDECLAARIRMPYGSPVTTLGAKAQLRADKTGSVRETLYGRAEVRIQVPDTIKKIDIAGAILFRHPSDDEVLIRMVNVMPADLDDPKKHRHKKGKPVPHFSAYYRLLRDSCPNAGGPNLLVDCDTDECVGEGEAVEIQFVDPYNCTIGSGCDQSDINC